MLEKQVEIFKDGRYSVFRILVGFLFFQHGAMKLFGWFGGNKVANLMTLFGAAGIIEVVVGLLLVFGLWSRLMALVGSLEMVLAYVWMHGSKGWNPMQNGGEAALLYIAAFLVIYTYDSGKYSLDAAMKKQ